MAILAYESNTSSTKKDKFELEIEKSWEGI